VSIDFTKEIRVSKHFRNTWLRKWEWDINDLRSALLKVRIEKVGTTKFEAYIRSKKGGKKIIFAYNGDEIFIIKGAEGT